MFGRDKTPPAPWSVELLTTEYVVAGEIVPDDQQLAELYLQYQSTTKNSGFLTVTSPQLRSVRGLNAAATPGGTWVANLDTALVAVIPRDPASIAFAQKNAPTQNMTPAAALVGPYHVAGTLRHAYDLGLVTLEHSFAMTDVEVTVTAPGWAGGPIAAPFAIVVCAHLHGLVVA